MSRNFTIYDSETGKKGGVFTGRVPSDAAKKAAKKIFDEYKGRKRTLDFQIREHGTDIVSHYQATVEKLNPPRKIVRDGKEILISKSLKVFFMGRNTTACKPTAYLSVRSASPSPSA